LAFALHCFRCIGHHHVPLCCNWHNPLSPMRDSRSTSKTQHKSTQLHSRTNLHQKPVNYPETLMFRHCHWPSKNIEQQKKNIMKWSNKFTTRSPELKKVVSDLDSKTSKREVNWLTVIVTKQLIIKNLYLWLVIHNCLLILTCSLNIVFASDSHPSKSLWSPSNLRIWSSQVSLKITHANKNKPVL